jgi:hypothetical protein
VMWFQSIGCSTQHPTTAADSLWTAAVAIEWHETGTTTYLLTYLPTYLYLSTTTTTSPLVTTQSDDEVVVWCDSYTLIYQQSLIEEMLLQSISCFTQHPTTAVDMVGSTYRNSSISEAGDICRWFFSCSIIM